MKKEFIDIESLLIKGGDKSRKEALKLILEIPKAELLTFYIYLKDRHSDKIDGWLMMLLSQYSRS